MLAMVRLEALNETSLIEASKCTHQHETVQIKAYNNQFVFEFGYLNRGNKRLDVDNYVISRSLELARNKFDEALVATIKANCNNNAYVAKVKVRLMFVA